MRGARVCAAPSEPAFLAWLETVRRHWIHRCSGNTAPAYLVQAVQSLEQPVPLLAGRQALLRVFPTARTTTSQGIPDIRARFYVGGRETHVVDIPGKSTPIPTEMDQSTLAKSANAEIPGEVVQPGLEMVIEVDPDRTLDPALGVVSRIPDTGRLAVDVRAIPRFDLTLIPFIWSQGPDSSIVDVIEAIAADPDDLEILGRPDVRLPISDFVVTAHEPVLSSTNSAFRLLNQTAAIRAMEGGQGYYLGLSSSQVTGAVGVGSASQRSAFSAFPGPTTHELGHTMGLGHAPCGGAFGPDPFFPHSNGTIGVWGYDFDDGGTLVLPGSADVMGYCSRSWISDYHFTKALRYRLANEGTPGAAATAAPVQSLLVWGGVDADGLPHLEPTFVVEAPAALPDSAGEWHVIGRTGRDGELFSLSFTMPEVADGDGSSSFAFVLPAQPGWAGNLASITLTGPGGTFTLDGESGRSMAILRNPRNGQIRGILRDVPPATQAAADALGHGVRTGLEVLFSRGIPGAEAWRR